MEEFLFSITISILSRNTFPPSQCARTYLHVAAPVQPSALSPNSTNRVSDSIFPVHGIRNDTAKFCYQAPFLQLLCNTLTENDIAAYLLRNIFFDHFLPVLIAYKRNLLINNPSDKVGSDHAHGMLKALRNFFTTCSPANFPQYAQGEMGTFYLHMVKELPASIQDRFLMVQRIVNTKANCFAHTDTPSYILELKIDDSLLDQSRILCLQKLVYDNVQLEEVLTPLDSWKCRNGKCETHANSTLTSTRLTEFFGRPPILTMRLSRPPNPTDSDLKMERPIIVTVPIQLRVHPTDQVVYRPYLSAHHLGAHRNTGHVVTQMCEVHQPASSRTVFLVDDSYVSIANDITMQNSQTNSEMFFFVRCTEYDASLKEFKTPLLQESANDFLCSCLAST